MNKIDYKENDDKLLYQIKENNDDARDYLYEKYSALIHKEINSFKKQALVLGIDISDLRQEAFLAFSDAINQYDEINETKFSTYATMVIKRKLLTLINRYACNKNIFLRESLKLGNKLELAGYDAYSIDKKEPLDTLIADELLDSLKNKMISNLSKNECEVLLLYISGLSIEEISDKLKITTKQVYNYIYRARNKLKSD